MSYVLPPAAAATVPVLGRTESFPVHRIYCVGRNYVEHAKEIEIRWPSGTIQTIKNVVGDRILLVQEPH